MSDRSVSSPAPVPLPANVLWRALDATLGGVFGTLSRLRRTRSIHPRGITYTAKVTVVPRRRRTGVTFLDEAATYNAVVRLSRGAGFNAKLLDVGGWALRVEDAFGPGRPLDLMLSSTGRAPVARHVLVPMRGFVASTFSSLFRYKIGGKRRWLAAIPIVDHATHSAPAYRVCVASRFGRWTEVARVEIGDQLPVDAGAALHFNVVRHCDPTLRPDGWIQALRDRSYVASHRGAPAAGRRDIVPTDEPVVTLATHG